MTEINVISLMGQLNRGHSAKLMDHSENALEKLSTEIAYFMFSAIPFESKDCYGTRTEMAKEIKKLLEKDPQIIIAALNELPDTTGTEKLIERIKTIV